MREWSHSCLVELILPMCLQCLTQNRQTVVDMRKSDLMNLFLQRRQHSFLEENFPEVSLHRSTTKSRVSSRAAAEGIEVIIANGRRDGILTDLVLTGEEVPCTRFEPAPRAASGVKKWIASSEGFAKGILRIDQGAAAAVRASKAASILAVGVTAVEGDFERDDLVRILSPDGAQLAVGRISCDSATARRNIGRKGLKPLVHCDYLYLE